MRKLQLSPVSAEKISYLLVLEAVLLFASFLEFVLTCAVMLLKIHVELITNMYFFSILPGNRASSYVINA